MRKNWKILTAGFLSVALTGGITAYGDVSRSLHPVTIVTA